MASHAGKCQDYAAFLRPAGGLTNDVSGDTSWRSGQDLGKLYDNATPNPTGSLSGPYFVDSVTTRVIGVSGKTSHLACTIKNLGNQTVM